MCLVFVVRTRRADRGVDWRRAGLVMGVVRGAELGVLQAPMLGLHPFR